MYFKITIEDQLNTHESWPGKSWLNAALRCMTPKQAIPLLWIHNGPFCKTGDSLPHHPNFL